MLKRIMFVTLLAGLLAGCQTNQPPQAMEESAPVPALEQEQPEAEAVVSDVMETEEVVTEMVETESPETNAVAADVAEPAVEPPVAAPVEVVLEPETTLEQPKEQERNKTMILMKTSKGDIKLELNPEKAPETVENFLGYVKSGHYDGTVFHRVINGFMIQGGGFDASMKQKPAPDTVVNEADNGLANDVGTIAMARTPDPHSASAQFFINVNDNAFLNFRSKTPQGWGYAVFGKVVEGMDVVNAIKEVKTGTVGPFQDVPVEPVMIESVSIIEK